MSFSWNTIGKESPLIRGLPAQFDEAESTFVTIGSRTRPLTSDLEELRCGQSEGFSGAAARSFAERIGDILTPLSDVPVVSSRIARVFRHHTVTLETLRREAGQALARAQTHWHNKVGAENERDKRKRRLSSLSRQIEQLSCDCSPEAQARVDDLRSRHSSVSHQLHGARQAVHRAEDALEDSRNDWTRIRQDEDELNERTSHKLEALPLWSLKDTDNFWTEAKENVWEGVKALWEYVSEHVLEGLYEFLDKMLLWLDIAGFVLEFIPVVNGIYKLAELATVGLKSLVGIGLMVAGKMSFAEWMIGVACDSVGFLVPGGKLAMKGLKNLKGPLGGSAKRLEQGLAPISNWGRTQRDNAVSAIRNKAFSPFKPHRMGQVDDLLTSGYRNAHTKITDVFDSLPGGSAVQRWTRFKAPISYWPSAAGKQSTLFWKKPDTVDWIIGGATERGIKRLGNEHYFDPHIKTPLEEWLRPVEPGTSPVLEPCRLGARVEAVAA